MKTILVLLIVLIVSTHCSKSTPAEVHPAKISAVQFTPVRIPVFTGKPDQILYSIKFQLNEGSEKVLLKSITLNFTSGSRTEGIASVSAVREGAENQLFGKSQTIGNKTILTGNTPVTTNTNLFNLLFTLKNSALLTTSFEIQDATLNFSDNQTVKINPDSRFVFRPGILMRAAGQDQVDTYRIPGLTRTNAGTLIAVYDIRYLNGGDLQGHIDVGMSRSSDTGQTWQPMKKIMDMGEWGGKPEIENGIGDPCVLVDKNTGTIWVAALWGHGKPGKSVWGSSGPGMTPAETGQFMLVKSDDDGLTWSDPINITTQVKKTEWRLFFQGPGNGITMNDGTLVFPAQYKDTDQVPWSTLIYSKDHGKTWTAGTGAKSNTTEAQIVELKDGSLMLNMRDDRNRTDKGVTNGRAVAVTNDLGKTWSTHPSSNSALPEPNCMASIISANVKINGASQQVLFFSNPNNKTDRANMTIKASIDGGMTWPVTLQAELNSQSGFGYSCLTMVDENTIGIVYEGVKELYFQKISISDLLGNLIK